MYDPSSENGTQVSRTDIDSIQYPPRVKPHGDAGRDTSAELALRLQENAVQVAEYE